jgi:hypothetical protein
MPSPAAIVPDCYYHIYNRGNNRGNIFKEHRNYEYFMRQYWKHAEPIADTFAYCLLMNHFHILIRTKPAEILERIPRGHKPGLILGNFFNGYAKAINKAYNRTGSLFENPFERRPVLSLAHLQNLVCYIHRNPQRHGIVPDFRQYSYSSYPLFIQDNPTPLKTKTVLDWFGGYDNFYIAHRERINPDHFDVPVEPELWS